MVDYNKMKEIASFLGKEEEATTWEKLADIANCGDVYLTFWGQFSAGKSKLINNIVGRDILPVKRTETTAVLTYVRFGENEGCRIRYGDGRTEDRDLSYALSITQQTAGEEAQRIEYLELTVNTPELTGNLVIVDTPGINTLHQRHQQLAEEAVRQSGKLVYVLSGTPSKVDRESIEAIARDGLDILFVRTHCDSFNELEENPDDSLKKEQDDLETMVGHKIEFFPVSNNKENVWHDNINKLRVRVAQIAANIEEERQKGISMRCEAVGKRYATDLNRRIAHIDDLLTGNSMKVEQEIIECQAKVDRLSGAAETRENMLRKQMQNIEAEAKDEIHDVCDASKRRFGDILRNEPDTQSTVEEIPRIFDKELKKSIIKMEQAMEEKLSAVVTASYDDIYRDIADFERPEAPGYEEIKEENSALIDQTRAKLMAVRKKIEELDRERTNASFDAKDAPKIDEADYADALRQLDAALEQIPTDTPMRLADEGSSVVSDAFRNLGKVADLALLLVPGEQIAAAVKGAVNATKLAQGLQKMGKVGKMILKAGGVAAKNASLIDKGRDLAYGVGRVFGGRNYATSKNRKMAKVLVDKVANAAGNAFDEMKNKKNAGEPSFFDYISAEYWFGKFGGLFDEPPKMEVDSDEEARRNQLRREITEKKQRIVEEKIEKMRQIGIIKNKEKELAIRQQEQENMKAEIEQELKKSGQELREASVKESVIRYKTRYIEYFADVLDQVSQKFIQSYMERARQDIELYVERENLSVMSALSAKKTQLENLMKSKVSGESLLKEQISLCKDYLGMLQEAQA